VYGGICGADGWQLQHFSAEVFPSTSSSALLDGLNSLRYRLRYDAGDQKGVMSKELMWATVGLIIFRFEILWELLPAIATSLFF
jgi:hypothetical protein